MGTSTPDTVYFVCSGNTCRSPMAEHLMRHALEAQPEPLASTKVASFGTSAFSGYPASENAVFALSKVGVDLRQHRSQSAEQISVDAGIAFFCMTRSHQDTLMNFWDIDPKRIYLMREWVETPPGDIPDPFGMDVNAYLQCRDSIVESIPGILEFLRKTLRV